MHFEEAPYKIKGDYTCSFLKENNDFKKYPLIKSLIEEQGEEYVDKALWSVYFLIDPRSFFYDKMSYLSRLSFIRKNYNTDFNDGIEFKKIIEFYEDNILKNEDIRMYLNMKKQLQIGIETNRTRTFTIQKAIKSKEALINDGKRTFSSLNDFEGHKDYYPRTIEGDVDSDNFFDKNKEVLLYPEISNLIKEEGIDNVSKIMWAFYCVRDPKSFYYDKMTIEELEERYIKKYNHINIDDYVHIDTFYTENILLNEDKVDYQLLLVRHKLLIEESGGINVEGIKEGKEQLIEFKNKISKEDSAYMTLVFQGDEQPGLLARTKLN